MVQSQVGPRLNSLQQNRKATQAKMILKEQQLLGLFQRHDKNGDGCLDKQELKLAFKELGAYIPGYRASQALRNADIDGDGHISDDEMNALVEYAAQLKYTIK